MPTGVNLNQYAGPGSHIRWQSDNEPLFGPQNSPELIVSTSLSYSVEFQVRRRAPGEVPSSIRLGRPRISGSELWVALTSMSHWRCSVSDGGGVARARQIEAESLKWKMVKEKERVVIIAGYGTDDSTDHWKVEHSRKRNIMRRCAWTCLPDYPNPFTRVTTFIQEMTRSNKLPFTTTISNPR